MLRVKQERKSKGMTQVWMARLTGLNQPIYSLIENGKHPAFPAYRIRIAKALGFPEDQADELFKEIANEQQ